MSDIRLGSRAAWIQVLLEAILCLITALLALVWLLFGSEADFPPTWYWVLSVLLSVADVAAMCYIAFRVVRGLLRRASPMRAVRSAVFLLLLLGAFHATTIYAYSQIPQWDFQDGLFDDLSWPGPGKISQECQQQPSVSGGQFISYEEAQGIARSDDLRVRQNEFSGKTTGGWHGWITELSRHGYYSNPEHRLMVMTMDNPYSTVAGSERRPLSQAVISYFSPDDIAKLSVGQEVLVCGAISDATLDNYGGTWISISRPVMNTLPMPEALAGTNIPPDFQLKYEVHGCGQGYACPEYNISIDATGTATYNGQDNVTVTGTHTTQVPSNKLRELVFELRRTGFLSLGGVPGRIEGTLQGATMLHVRMDGKSKTAALPWLSGPWPHAINMINGKLEEVTNLRQWVNLVRSP